MSSEARIIPMSRESRILACREQLMKAAICFVREGQDGTERDRLRKASSLSGLPECIIESAIGEVSRIKVGNGE